ncbi:MAG: hypothetical protein G3I10_09480 [Ferrovum sp.]|nr:hypothetical protein [Ferrovum sp.]
MEALKKILGKIDYPLAGGTLIIMGMLFVAYRAGYGDGVNLSREEIPDLKKIVARYEAWNQVVMTSPECQKAMLEAGMALEKRADK